MFEANVRTAKVDCFKCEPFYHETTLFARNALLARTTNVLKSTRRWQLNGCRAENRVKRSSEDDLDKAGDATKEKTSAGEAGTNFGSASHRTLD